MTANGSAKIAEPLAGLAVKLDRLEPDPRNPRRGEVEAIARSYERFGQRKPIVARRTGGTARAPRGTVIAGNHQLAAAAQLGWDKIAVVWVDDDDATATAFALADNRTSDLAGYDNHALAELLGELDAELLEAAGWGTREVDKLLGDVEREREKSGNRGQLLALSDVTVGEPLHEVKHGEVYHLRVGAYEHVLVIVEVLSGWPTWVEHLDGAECLFCPYPDPYITYSTLVDRHKLVMVQPDAYLAGHLLDKHAAAWGEDTIR